MALVLAGLDHDALQSTNFRLEGRQPGWLERGVQGGEWGWGSTRRTAAACKARDRVKHGDRHGDKLAWTPGTVIWKRVPRCVCVGPYSTQLCGDTQLRGDTQLHGDTQLRGTVCKTSIFLLKDISNKISKIE